MKTTFNVRTKTWEKFKLPSIEDVIAIVGKDVLIGIDSEGNIEIDKDLTPQERALIGAL